MSQLLDRHVERTAQALALRKGGRPSLRSAAKLWHSASSRRGKIDTRAGGDDAGRIDGPVAAVIVPLDMVEMYRLGDAGYLIKRAHVVPQLRKIHQAIAVALEVAVVYGIEA